MAISRSLMNRQLRASGGIMDVTPRENFGLGSSLKKFVRKIIPNEVADIAVKAAPFVAPFNPALAGAMSGIGTFDQTGSIGDSLKAGAMNYGGGQLARYAGGAGFQGNPFGQGGAFTQGGFQSGFSSPLGNQTGLGKFFSKPNAPISEVQSIGTTGDASIAEQIAAQGRAVNAEQTGLFTEGLTGGAETITDAATQTITGSPNQITITDSIKQIVSPNSTIGDRGNAALDLLKRGSKAAFTKSDGKGGTIIDKAAVMGAIAFAGSYAEALALADDAGVELTEEAYDEAKKTEKKEEYAGYLTNFFGGKKDGGRIGYEGGANELIKNKLMEDIMPDTSTEEMIMIMTDDGPKMIKRSDYEAMPGMFRDTTTSLYGDAARGRPVPEFANGGRIGYARGTPGDNTMFEELNVDTIYRPEPESTITLPEEMPGDDRMAGSQGYDEQYNSFIQLRDQFQYQEGDSYSDANRKAKQIVYGMKDGGRVNRRLGSPEEGEGSGLMEMLSVEVDAGGDDQEDMKMAGITFSSAEKSYLFRKLGGAGGSDRSFTMPQLYRVLSNPDRYSEDAAVLKEIAIMGLGKKDGGRIGYKGGANRVSELLIKRAEMLGKDADADVSHIDGEIFQLTGKTFRSVGGISEIPTGEPRLNAGGVAERDYRQTGGFVPVGIKERADDVPAMLSKNEFVMTADAVRGIGNGSVEEGSKKLYNTMKQAEKVGKA